MAKRFVCVSVGVLCLAAAYQVLVERVGAEWDPGVSPIVGGAFLPGGVWIGFAPGGQAWSITPNAGWIRRQELDLPVGSADVAFLDSNGDLFVLVTTTGDVWELSDNGFGWFQLDTFPGGPIPIEPETWGKVKAKHR